MYLQHARQSIVSVVIFSHFPPHFLSLPHSVPPLSLPLPPSLSPPLPPSLPTLHPSSPPSLCLPHYLPLPFPPSSTPPTPSHFHSPNPPSSPPSHPPSLPPSNWRLTMRSVCRFHTFASQCCPLGRGAQVDVGCQPALTTRPPSVAGSSTPTHALCSTWTMCEHEYLNNKPTVFYMNNVWTWVS